MKILYKSLFFAALLVAFGCDDDFDSPIEEIQITSGTADFSKYVAIGNSLTSGYADGTLYKSAQENSFPAIIASQMSAAGGGAFNQPLMQDNIGGFADLDVPGKLYIGANGLSRYPAETNFASSFVQGPFNNMGVPGMKSYHLLAPGYGDPQGIAQGLANPYFARMASSSSATVMQDIVSQQPTFFSVWLANNDVLSFATSGGVGQNQTGNLDPSTYGGNDISDPQVVASVLNGLMETLVLNGGASGVIANLPYVTSIPFFTKVPALPLDPTSESYAAQIPTLNATYAQLNQIFAALGVPERQINFATDAPSGIIFVDDSLPDLSAQIAAVMIQAGLPASQAQLYGSIFGQVRQSKEGDLIPLSMSSKIGTVDTDRVTYLMSIGVPQEQAGQLSVVGLTYPADQWVLSMDEVAQATEATATYNQIIEQLASTYQIAHVDMNQKMQELQSGIVFNGVGYSADFISGGAFSLDGVHLNERGYAIVANYFIDAINTKYGSNLRHVNPNNYAGINLP